MAHQPLAPRPGELEAGAWFHGTLYPRRCDLSPDGQLLYYFALKGGPSDFLGGTYSAVSKAPVALRPGRLGARWGPGAAAITSPAGRDRRGGARSSIGSLAPLRFGLHLTPVVQYAAERRRGWVEHTSCPPRAASDTWDEKRAVVLAKARPGGGERLVLTRPRLGPGDGIEGRHPTYRTRGRPPPGELAGVVWADWSPRGRLLCATADGRLEIRALRNRDVLIEVSHDLAPLAPDPVQSPGWAQRW